MNLMVKFQNNYRFFCVKVAKMYENNAFLTMCITLFINIINRNTIKSYYVCSGNVVWGWRWR